MSRRMWQAVAAALVLSVAFVTLERVLPHGAARAVDDLGQLLAAATAAGLTGRHAHRVRAPGRLSWWLMSGATGSWALGQAVWSWYELVAHRPTPVPSLADVGFIAFDVLAVPALLLWPSVALRGSARWRTLLDGVLVAASLFIVSWTWALGPAVRAGADSRLSYVVTLAYPIFDLILLTAAVVVVSHAHSAARTGLTLIAGGLSLFCLADGGFAYLTAAGTYSTGSIVDACWFAGFLLVAVGGLTHGRPARVSEQPDGIESVTRALLPYLPATVGLSLVVAMTMLGHPERVTTILARVVVLTLLVRQLLAVLENRRLAVRLTAAQRELQHLAFHDPLTGLANRALLADRMRHALDLHRRDGRRIGVLFCDLDRFKAVNDSLGHEAGDQVLRAIAERLMAVTRAGDTVARMGGDEFAVLLEDGGAADAVAEALSVALSRPLLVSGTEIELGVSIGTTELGPGDVTVEASELLSRVDSAMYVAKRGGRGVVRWPSVDPIGEHAALDEPLGRAG